MFSRVMTTLVSFKFRKHTLTYIAFHVSVVPRPIFKVRGEESCRMYEIVIRAWAKWDRVRKSSADYKKMCNCCHCRKTTVIIFKIFGIERAWQSQGCVVPRPRQLFVTKSRLLAEKVERDYVSLLYSLSAGPDAPLYVRERIQRWNTRRKKVIFNPDDTEGERDDLPQKFSELRDSDFPLFLTMDTVSTAHSMNVAGTKRGCVCVYSSRAFCRLT